MNKKIPGLILALLVFYYTSFSCPYGEAETLPLPTFDNSVIFSFSYDMVARPDSEIEYIGSQFGNGLYARLHLSRFAGVNVDWHHDIANVNIPEFTNIVDSLLEKARLHKVGIHICLIMGLAGNKYLYQTAEEEDIRNAQWYNENNLASRDQLGRGSGVKTAEDTYVFDLDNADIPLGPGAAPAAASASTNSDTTLFSYVYGTFSRYARKLRAHLEAKMGAAFRYLKQVQEENPDVLIIVSAPGEADATPCATTAACR